MDNLIKLQCSGSPIEFARKLGISESHLYYSLKELKDWGLPIVYSRVKGSYCYSEDVRLDIYVAIRDLKREEKIVISGGEVNDLSFFSFPLFYNQSLVW